MARYLGPKYKICRRIGENLWGRAKDPSAKRPYPAGEHGAARGARRKLTNYGIHLQEKQKLRMYYGLLEKQFRLTFKRAARMHGVTGDNLLMMLETRLDAVCYRSGLAATVWSARQFVSHGHVLVNGKKVNIPSYQLRPGDVVTVREKSRKHPQMLEAMQQKPSNAMPPYLSRDDNAFSVKLESKPEAADIPIPVQLDMNLIVEFYSR
ncbi:30S ribosomal protein S4 [Candidatus Sumerlaeota bacterium]|nr:30S ribosomal protein S4 [Candidatus Sumerlaeota bacterium]